ncbi:MAG: exo-beta-N-acetylmuramidase NamZ domain-containing protein [Verrucomicrobiota bacterium]
MTPRPILTPLCLVGLTAVFLLAPSVWGQNSSGAFHTDKLRAIDQAFETAIAEKKIPGAVVWLEHGGEVYHRAYGNRQTVPEVRPMTRDTLFDAASLTKVVATAPAVMRLVEKGLIDVEARVAQYLPRFNQNGNEKITVRQLLTHTSGLRPVVSRKTAWSGRAAALELIYNDQPMSEAGKGFRYSDVNYILLGELVKAVSGRPLNEFVVDELYKPLGMNDSGFQPAVALKARIAPTTVEDGELVHGVVHDPVSRLMDGVAGHAGLFLTASDLARYARMLLNFGQFEEQRLFSLRTVKLMTSVQSPPDVETKRGFGWDIRSRYSAPRGAHFGPASYGHTGWTGTSIWIDPFTKTFLLILSNRNHPTEDGRTTELRREVATRAAESRSAFDYKRPGEDGVRNGIDVLKANGFSQLKYLRVGLITNHTGIDHDGKSTIELLRASPDVKLQALFSPEHGIEGTGNGPIENATSGELPVYSLYKEKTRRPTQDQLKNLDALVFDIQDIGCRFYTYISTMGGAMEAAAEAGIGFFVLDRLNPIDGQIVDGPVMATKKSFTAYHDIPIIHGMTVGELAKMFAREKKLDLKLVVVPVQGWKRSMQMDATRLPWVNPSPNIRNLEQAIIYPGVGMLEFLNLSVGRGTDTPFQLVGAPYLDNAALLKALAAENLPGVNFTPVEFTPTSSVFKGQVCKGVRITLTNRRNYQALDVGLVIGRYLATRHAAEAKLEKLNTLIAHRPTVEALKGGKSLADIRALWKSEREAFMARRAPFLLY